MKQQNVSSFEWLQGEEIYGPGLNMATKGSWLCLRTFSCPLDDKITIALPFLLTHESTSQQWEYLPYWYHWGQRRLSSGGIKSGLKPSLGPLALKLRLRAHISAHEWVSVYVGGMCIERSTKSTHVLPQKEERRTEESWVLGVQLYKSS